VASWCEIRARRRSSGRRDDDVLLRWQRAQQGAFGDSCKAFRTQRKIVLARNLEGLVRDERSTTTNGLGVPKESRQVPPRLAADNPANRAFVHAEFFEQIVVCDAASNMALANRQNVRRREPR